eukprot:COSAG02_NODE_1293_length_13410_cov_13.392004_4_plen_37_part_00
MPFVFTMHRGCPLAVSCIALLLLYSFDDESPPIVVQ